MPVLTPDGRTKSKMAATGLTSADAFAYDGPGQHPLSKYLHGAMAYDTIYEKQLWAYVCASTLVDLQILLPGKVYRRAPRGREDGRQSPFGQLMAKPSKRMDPVRFWAWFALMHQVHGCSFALKVRDRLGRPDELRPVHPTRMRYGPKGGGFGGPGFGGIEKGPDRWWYLRSLDDEVPIERTEFIYWPKWSARGPEVGMSPMEPLRDTLENEAGARAANSAMWRNGGKHSMVLKHPKVFGEDRMATQRLADQYERRHGGVANWNRPLVLEEGMDAEALTMTNEDLQYIDARKLNREEVAAAYKIPPPAIGILDRATFSNIVEQNRSLYRQTMAPTLQSFEAMIDFDLRDGSFDSGRGPDFGDAFYFEWLVDGVMRGNFEQRTEAYARAVQTGQMTPAEVRDLENRPFLEGTDQLFMNSAAVPISLDDDDVDPRQLAELVQKVYLGTPDKVVLSTDEARQILNRAGADLSGPGPGGPAALAAPIGEQNLSVVMGRLSRPTSLDEIDAELLVEGLEPIEAEAVQGSVAIARLGDMSVAQLRQIIKEIGL